MTKTATITITVETKTTTAWVGHGVDDRPAHDSTALDVTMNFGYTGPPINGTAIATFADRLPIR